MDEKFVRHSIDDPELRLNVASGKEMAWVRQFLKNADLEQPTEPRRAWARLRSRLDRWRMPYQATVGRVRFEIATPTERHRIVEQGGEAGYLGLVLSLLKPEDILYDIGVCVGLVSLSAASRCRVVGFEPEPNVRSRFNTNLALNPQLDVELHSYAIGDADGSAMLHLDPAMNTSASLRRQRDEPDAVEVEMRTLDSLVFDEGLRLPTAIKLDIEGAELLALQGASRLLASERRPRWLFLELHPALLPAFGGSAEQVLDILEGVDYRPRHLEVRSGQIHLILEAC